MINNIEPEIIKTKDYNTAMNSFITHMNQNCNKDGYYNFTINKGRRFDKVVRGTSVYCFVEKETGFIFKAASWKSPQLKTKKPVRGSIFETSTYESKAGPHGGWLYQ